MREAIEHLQKALEHTDKACKPLAKRERTLDNSVLVRLVDNARQDIASALLMLRGEEKETCEKS